MGSSSESLCTSLKMGSLDAKIKTLEKIRTNFPELQLEDKIELSHQLIEITRDSVKFGKPTEFTSFMHKLLLTLHRFKGDETLLSLFRKENVLLEKLSLWPIDAINTTNEQNVEMLLEMMDTLTEDILIVWKPPFLKPLIQNCFHILQTRRSVSYAFIFALKTLVNLCVDSPSSLSTARSIPEFKKIWKIFAKISELGMSRGDIKVSQCAILASHLMFLFDFGHNSRILDLGFNYAQRCCEQLFDQTQLERQDPMDITCLADVIRYFATLAKLTKLRQGSHNPNSDCNGDADSQTQEPCPGEKDQSMSNTFYNAFEELALSTIKLIDDSKSCFETLDWVTKIMKMVPVLTPDFLRTGENMWNIYRVAFGLVRYFTQSQERLDIIIPSYTILETQLQLFSQGMDASPNFVDHCKGELQFVIANAKLVDARTSEGEKTNIACCRIYSLAQRVPSLTQLVDTKLQEQLPIYDGLLKRYLELPESKILSDVDFDVNPGRIVCVIEILGLLSDHSTNARILGALMSYISKPTTAAHISAAIFCGDDKVISRALTILRSVPFTSTHLKEVSRAIAGTKIAHPNNLNSRSGLSAGAAMGLGILEQSLEVTAAAYNSQEVTVNNDDVVAFYEMRSSLFESEAQALKDQMYEISKTNDQLRSLLKKQAHLLSGKLSELDVKNRNNVILSSQLEKADEQLLELETNALKELEDQKAAGVFKDKKLVDCYKRIQDGDELCRKLQQQVTELTTKVTKAEAQLETAQKEVETLGGALQKEQKNLKAKIVSLERDLRKTEEERKRHEAALELERKKLDTMRAILGRNADGTIM